MERVFSVDDMPWADLKGLPGARGFEFKALTNDAYTSLAPGEWRLWIDRSAERLRIPRATLQDPLGPSFSARKTGEPFLAERGAVPPSMTVAAWPGGASAKKAVAEDLGKIEWEEMEMK